jgi:hypothetical protein
MFDKEVYDRLNRDAMDTGVSLAHFILQALKSGPLSDWERNEVVNRAQLTINKEREAFRYLCPNCKS